MLIAPEWAIAGVVAGGAVVVLRRRRLVELVAWATVVAVGALVTIRERRNAPAPNGGWPAVFESWHHVAMFAVVSVLVAALFADDAAVAHTDSGEIVMTKPPNATQVGAAVAEYGLSGQ